jgi:hypothetical protein
MKIYVTADGDDIGARVERLALANREDELSKLSASIKQFANMGMFGLLLTARLT